LSLITHSVLVDLLVGFVPSSSNSFSQAWVLPNITASRPTVSNVWGTHFTISPRITHLQLFGANHSLFRLGLSSNTLAALQFLGFGP
jgi:hypothetical protein